MTQLAASVTAIIAFFLLFLLCIAAAYDIIKSLNQIINGRLKLSIVAYLLSVCIASISFIIYNLAECAIITSSNSNPSTLELISTIALIIRFISYCTVYISIAYFLKIKVENVYNNTFLAVNRLFMNIFFIIYVISALFSIIMFIMVNCGIYWNENLSQSPFDTIWNIATIQFSVFLNIYSIFILIVFNRNLHLFISLTLKNDQTLSSEINNRLKNETIKQTNLMSFIIYGSITFQIVYFLHWIKYPHSDTYLMLYDLLYFIFLTCSTISIYLTFQFNSYHYHIWCKYCHMLCIYVCSKSIKQDQHHNNTYSVPLINIQNSHTSINIQLSELPISCNINECICCAQICQLLNNYNGQSIKYIPTNYNYTISDILNDFHHLLSYHDSSNDFNFIFQKLTKSTKQICHYKNCKIYSQNQMRRIQRNKLFTEQKESEFEFDIKHNILDKIHSFYYHSYDTFFRSNDKFEVRTNRNRNKNNTQFMVSKFSSNFDDNINHNDNNNRNIYSFGQRFEYIDRENKWFVKPKYYTLKNELIDNEKCNISLNIYNYEYEKCVKYMNTQRIQRIQNKNRCEILSEYHILILLIYCNCDLYQNKWSGTYRRIRVNKELESDMSLKKRHSFFYYSSMYLRQIIEFFGERLIDDKNKNKTFYHGVNKILYLTRTTTQFNGPLSTSTEINVASNFSGNIGMVLQLKYSFSTYPLNAKYFDCAFFSDYVNEKECLFLGGVPVMIITNIIDIKTGDDYKKYINALNIINCLLNGTFYPNDNNNNYKANKYSINLCCKLLKHKLSELLYNDIPEYIKNLLNEFCNNLTNIMIFWHNLEFKMTQNMLDLFCNNKNDELLFFDLSILFKLFPNLQQIEYFNKDTNNLDIATEQIIEQIASYHSKSVSHLKYVIIHREASMVERWRKDTNLYHHILNENKNWNLFKDDKKIIAYQDNNEFDVESLHFRFNQINQAATSNQMVQNCLQDLIHD